jgi:hypothetical protein
MASVGAPSGTPFASVYSLRTLRCLAIAEGIFCLLLAMF